MDMSQKNTKPYSVLVGFYEVDGYGADSVETPSTQDGKRDYDTLARLIKERHPKATSFHRIGSKFEIRDGTNLGPVEIPAGSTIGQLFLNEDNRIEAAREIGKVFFNGTPQKIMLVFLRAQGHVAVRLHPDLHTEGVVYFPNKFSPQRLATELPEIIRSILGQDAREMKLNFREATPTKPI